MCGLVGAFSVSKTFALSEFELNNFNNLLYCSALRGGHSTGVMTWDGEHIRQLKSAYHPADFLFSDIYAKFLKGHKKGIKAIFGHTRLATSGKITANNSHPFRVNDHIILMHNGMVRSVGKETVSDYEVDSMALANALTKAPAEEVLRSFDGAAAVIWMDKKEGTLNIWRNNDRPIAMTDSRVTQYLMSEGKMLDAILNRNGSQHHKVGNLESNTFLTWKLDQLDADPVSKKVYKSYSGWNHDDGPHTGYDGGWEDRRGYMYRRRGGNTDPVDGTQKSTDTGRLLEIVKPTTPIPGVVISDRVKKEQSDILLAKLGPYEVHKDIICLVVDRENYMNKGESQFKLIACPVLEGVRTDYDNAKVVFSGQSQVEADKWSAEEYVFGRIVSIIYNRHAEKDEDKVTVYVTNPRPASAIMMKKQEQKEVTK